MSDQQGRPIVEMRGITKAYRGVPAVHPIDFKLLAGEVHAILGENGAGKSTLTKMMVGVTEPTAGEILVGGKPVTFRSPAEALAEGVTMVFQETSLVLSMTVAQNLYLGREKFLNRLRGLNIAAVALARRLAGVLWAMWRDDTVYEPARVGLASARGLRREAQHLDVRAKALVVSAEKLRRRVRRTTRLVSEVAMK